MIKRSKPLVFLTCAFLALRLGAQSADTLRVMEFRSYLDLVMAHHPMMKRSALLPEQYALKVMGARGAFDPVLKGAFSQKEYDDKTYYQHLSGALVVPLLPGVELKSEVETNSGQYLNPENSQAVPLLAYTGVSVPLGRDLLMDERRNALRQAQAMNEVSWAAQAEQMNAVLLDAIVAWWDWQSAWQVYEVHSNGVILAEQRVGLMRSAYLQGNAAAVDTLEARLEVRKRKVDAGAAAADLIRARMRASTYLWSPEEEPLMLAENVRPEPFQPEELPLPAQGPSALLADLSGTHATLLVGAAKVDMLRIEQRYRRQNMLPDLRISAGALIPLADGSPAYGIEDRFKVTAGVYFPILLRKERAKFQEAGLLVQAEQLALDNKSREVEYYLTSAWGELNLLRGVVAEQRLSVTENDMLLKAEQRRFTEGESSLFVVIRRERSLLEAAEKLATLEAKYFQTFAKYLWAQGRPMQAEALPGYIR
jgi:outer membrane protein TolC